MTPRRLPGLRPGRDGVLVVTPGGGAGELWGFVLHCLALLRPGVQVPVFTEPSPEVEIPAHLSDSQVDLIASEARAQLDSQNEELRDLRSRALAMAAVALTELGLLAGTAGRFVDQGGPLVFVWIACFVTVSFGLAGMASVTSSRSDFYGLNISLLIAMEGDLRSNHVNELVASISLGNVTVDARRTVFRDALLCMVVGALAYGILWTVLLEG